MNRKTASKRASGRNPTIAAADVVTQAEEIGRTLDGLYHHRTLLTVTLLESSETFTSTILNVDLKKQHLLLDELFPREGHELVTKGVRLGVGARLNGAPVSFIGTVGEVGVDSDVAIYTLPFPDSVSCDEQRADHRIKVAFAHNIPVYVWAEISNPFRGKLYDLSTNAVGMRLEYAAQPTLMSGRNDFTCLIQFPGGENVRTAFELCAVSPRKQQPHIKVGGRLVDLNDRDR